MKMFSSWFTVILSVLASFIAFLTLMVAIASLVGSFVAAKRSQKQFNASEKRAQEAFIEQMQQSRDLNDALVKQVVELQNITSEQLEISNEQAKNQEDLSRKILMTTKPEALVLLRLSTTGGSPSRPDVDFSYDIEIQNTGARKASNLIINLAVVTSDYKLVALINPTPMDLHSGEKVYTKAKFSLPRKLSDVFYFALRQSIYDAELKEDFIDYRFFTRRRERGEPFEGVEDSDRLKTILDEALLSIE